MRSKYAYQGLLRAALWNHKDHVHGTIKWGHVMTRAKDQSTLPLISHVALQGHSEELNDTNKRLLQALLMQSANAHASANKAIARVFDALRDAGVVPVLLKGQGIAHYYEIPELRQCGDVDIYVGIQSYEKACLVLKEITGQDGIPGPKHCEFDYGGGLVIEIHKYTEVLPSTKQNAFYQKISDEGTSFNLVPLNIGGTVVPTPEDTFNAFYIFHHLWSHMMGMGVGYRQLCDWAVFLHTHKDTIDKARLATWLETLGLMKVWKVYGWAIVNSLHISAKEVPFADEKYKKKADRLVSYILKHGDNMDYKFGREDETKLQHKLGSLKYIFSKTYALMGIFPSKAMLFFWRSLSKGIKEL